MSEQTGLEDITAFQIVAIGLLDRDRLRFDVRLHRSWIVTVGKIRQVLALGRPEGADKGRFR